MQEKDGENQFDAFARIEQKMYNDTIAMSPLKPIDYRETERFLTTLSTCDKIGFWDTKENIDSLLPFVNDNPNGQKYLRVVETYITVITGWPNFQILENYAEKRLKIMISSGIYAHWEGWLRLMSRPPKLFHHYANWTHPRFDAESQLTPESKIVAGFYLFGICITGCLFCLLFETALLRRNSKKARTITFEFKYLE